MEFGKMGILIGYKMSAAILIHFFLSFSLPCFLPYVPPSLVPFVAPLSPNPFLFGRPHLGRGGWGPFSYASSHQPFFSKVSCRAGLSFRRALSLLTPETPGREYRSLRRRLF